MTIDQQITHQQIMQVLAQIGEVSLASRQLHAEQLRLQQVDQQLQQQLASLKEKQASQKIVDDAASGAAADVAAQGDHN